MFHPDDPLPYMVGHSRARVDNLFGQRCPKMSNNLVLVSLLNIQVAELQEAAVQAGWHLVGGPDLPHSPWVVTPEAYLVAPSGTVMS